MTYNHNTFARDLADQMVRERFGDLYGVESFDQYLDFVDQRQTQHLAEGRADHVLSRSGEQRRKTKLATENAGAVILRVPIKDCRRPGAFVWAEIELAAWLDLIENGADGAWCLMYKSKESTKGYVQTNVPMQGATMRGHTVPISRLIKGAGPGRITRFRDRNPLNLRHANIFISGNPNAVEGPVKGPKHDARAVTATGAALRQSRAGANFDFSKGGEQ